MTGLAAGLRRAARWGRARAQAALGGSGGHDVPAATVTPEMMADALRDGRDANRLVGVDVGGAGDLQPHWNRLRGVTDFIVYEPHLQSYSALVERQKTNPAYADFTYVNEALSGSGGSRALYVTNVPTGSSLLPPKRGGFSDYEGNTYFFPYTELNISTVTLAASLASRKIERIDLIKLDTQGSEVEILKGLDDSRYKNLLLVEAELSVLDHYEGGERRLEEALPWMREKGFTLFDFRAARFPGNILRLQKEAWGPLALESDLPPNAQRISELDAVFVREPKSVLDEGDPGKVRRLVFILLAYYFFQEAFFTIVEAGRRGLLKDADVEKLTRVLKLTHEQAKRELGEEIARVKLGHGSVWAQYMWVPYPSS